MLLNAAGENFLKYRNGKHATPFALPGPTFLGDWPPALRVRDGRTVSPTQITQLGGGQKTL